MKPVKLLTTLMIAVVTMTGITQNKPYSVSGKIMDAATDKPMEYATVMLLTLPDSSMVDGTTTHTSGKFTLSADEPGNYVLKAGFIGFDRNLQPVNFNAGNKEINLGEVNLKPSATGLEEVEISANRAAVEYKIDKKVVRVSEQFTAISGSAVDVLENVPSVQVDIEGNVSLRGNSNFTVLIDDRPTVLDANEALEQVPASMIENIEIITNPSAKYDPEGTGGIINIITKKKTLTGLNGLAHLKAGLDEKYGADLLLNYRMEDFNLFVGGDYNDRNYPGNAEEKSITDVNDTTFHLLSDGDFARYRKSYGLRAGIEWFPDDKNTWSLSARYGGRTFGSESDTRYHQFTNFDEAGDRYRSEETWDWSGDFYSINTEYTHLFDGREHRLDLFGMLYRRDGNEEAINRLRGQGGAITESRKSTESGPAQGFRYRANYERPFTTGFNIETGFQGRVGMSDETNEVFEYDTETGNFVFQPQFSNDVSYQRSYHAVYGLVKGELDKLGYQLGMRGEYTYRKIELTETGEDFNINRWDYFPSAHASYQLGKKNQVMASYSRRIDRPRGWYLEPFLTWSDAFNVRRGNPGLDPEYIDSYEVGYQNEFGKNALSVEIYHRSTVNRIERIRQPYEQNIVLHTFENVGTDYSTGAEVMLNTNPVKWLESSLTGNLYDYRVKGELNGRDFDRSSFTWSVRWNNIINITKNTRLQINPAYDSKEVEAQETESGYFVLHAAVRQNLMDKKLQLTLQVRDVLGTAIRESEIDEPGFYYYRYYERKTPIVMLNLTWRINNYKGPDQQPGDMNGGGMEGGR